MKSYLSGLFLLCLLSVAIAACDIEDESQEVYVVISPTPFASRMATRVATFAVQQAANEGQVTEEGMPAFLTPATGETQFMLPTNTMAVEPTEITPQATPQQPAFTPTSINDALRAQHTDRDIAIRLKLDRTCMLSGEAVRGNIEIESFKATPVYLYIAGIFSVSLNNSPLRTDVDSPVPAERGDFILLQTEQRYDVPITDFAQFVREAGVDAGGINFGALESGFPAGDYWVTVAYRNNQDGLTPQPDGSFLLPQAAFQGLLVSREVRFFVVDDVNNCPPGS